MRAADLISKLITQLPTYKNQQNKMQKNQQNQKKSKKKIK